MKPTLEKYIDPANIPKKYGGQLEFNFGDMPILEPAIVNSLVLSNGYAELPKQRGQTTLPIGPIKWREGRGKEMEAICVGRGDDGMIRDEVMTRVHTDFQGMHGIVRGPPHNTPIDWSLEKVVSTPGTETQPKEEGDLYLGADLAGENDTPEMTTPLVIRESNNSADKEKAGNGTLQAPAPTMDPSISNNGPENTSATLPAKPVEMNHNSLPVGESQPRTGTSESKFEQQDRTHAAGTLAKDTPHVVDHGNGEKTATVEPSTVGQAPKDVSANLPQPEEPPKHGMLDQAKQVADQAYVGAASVVGSVVEAVGLGGKSEEGEEGKEETGETNKGDKVEGKEKGNVEEFLRNKYPSEGATAELKEK